MAKEKKNQVEKKKSLVETPVPSRGRIFEGTVVKKFPKRVVIEFQRTVYVQKYSQFYRKRTRLHARLPDELENEINIGDYIKIRETRPLSKIIHFVVIEKVRSANDQHSSKLVKQNTEAKK